MRGQNWKPRFFSIFILIFNSNFQNCGLVISDPVESVTFIGTKKLPFGDSESNRLFELSFLLFTFIFDELWEGIDIPFLYSFENDVLGAVASNCEESVLLFLQLNFSQNIVFSGLKVDFDGILTTLGKLRSDGNRFIFFLFRKKDPAVGVHCFIFFHVPSWILLVDGEVINSLWQNFEMGFFKLVFWVVVFNVWIFVLEIEEADVDPPEVFHEVFFIYEEGTVIGIMLIVKFFSELRGP